MMFHTDSILLTKMPHFVSETKKYSFDRGEERGILRGRVGGLIVSPSKVKQCFRSNSNIQVYLPLLKRQPLTAYRSPLWFVLVQRELDKSQFDLSE